AALTNLEKAGGRVVAYVPSFFGSAPLATVETDINTYITQYGSLINGFFIDQMNVVPGTIPYYQAIYNYIKGLAPSYAVIANLGKAIQLNAGSVYLTDQNLPNPYAQLPSYWDQEVAAIQAADAVAAPEPGLVAKLASATLCWFLVVVARGLVRRRRLGRSAA